MLKLITNVSDISVILDHFDERVIQQNYVPYNGFNFYFLFITSVCLICVSHVVNLVYWTVRRIVNPMVNTTLIQKLKTKLYFSDLTSKGREFKSTEAPLPDPSLRPHLPAHPALLSNHRVDDPPGRK